MPPYLAGRKEEEAEFRRLLGQTTILENLILTGLRGVGKTVLADTFKPIAIQEGWLWTGTDLSETLSVSEDKLATRLLTDLSLVTSLVALKEERTPIGFVGSPEEVTRIVDYTLLRGVYDATPGLVSDKLKAVLEWAWSLLGQTGRRGLIFAYDEAQNLADNAEKDEYPLSTLLDVFQSIQRKNVPIMLVLVGLPTLFPQLVEARTYSERMFRIVVLEQLTEDESREAIVRPITQANWPTVFDESSANSIARLSGGYPYFIQFICKEVFDIWSQKIRSGDQLAIPIKDIIRKLDTDFFAGRWARATDRQRDLMYVIANLPNANAEFTVQEIVGMSKDLLEKGFGSSHVNQILSALGKHGLIYKNRHGRYSFAVPLMADFIKRQAATAT